MTEKKTRAARLALKHLCGYAGENWRDLSQASALPPVTEIKNGLKAFTDNGDMLALDTALTAAAEMIRFKYAGGCPEESHDAIALIALNNALRPD